MRRNWILAILTLAVLAGPVPAEDFSSPEWKDEIAHGYLPYKKLIYDDFPIANGVPTPHLMHTIGFLHYSFKANWTEDESGATAKVSQLTVRSGFDQNKSWQKGGITESKDLLTHEQGHLDINELHCNDFRKSPPQIGKGPTGAAAMEDLKTKLRALCDRFEAEARVEQDKYDSDTDHGGNQYQQELWNTAIRKRLDQARITYWQAPR